MHRWDVVVGALDRLRPGHPPPALVEWMTYSGMAVETHPGSIAKIVTPYSSASMAKASERRMTAALLVT